MGRGIQQYPMFMLGQKSMSIYTYNGGGEQSEVEEKHFFFSPPALSENDRDCTVKNSSDDQVILSHVW